MTVFCDQCKAASLKLYLRWYECAGNHCKLYSVSADMAYMQQCTLMMFSCLLLLMMMYDAMMTMLETHFASKRCVRG